MHDMMPGFAWGCKLFEASSFVQNYRLQKHAKKSQNWRKINTRSFHQRKIINIVRCCPWNTWRKEQIIGFMTISKMSGNVTT